MTAYVSRLLKCSARWDIRCAGSVPDDLLLDYFIQGLAGTPSADALFLLEAQAGARPNLDQAYALVLRRDRVA